MEKWIDVAEVNDLKDGSGTVVALPDGKEVALFRVDGNFYALDNNCAHMGGPLGEGEVSGKIVTCPWHHWQFDVTTGGFAVNPSESVQAAFSTRVEGSKVQIKIES